MLQYNDAKNRESKKLKDGYLLDYASKPSVTQQQTVYWIHFGKHHEHRSFEEKQEFLIQRK